MTLNNLGPILDTNLGIEKQGDFICKSCYYPIRNIGLIQNYRIMRNARL